MDIIVLTGPQDSLTDAHYFDNDAERDAFIERTEDGGEFCAAFDLGKPVYTTEGVGSLDAGTPRDPNRPIYDDSDHPRYGPVRRMHIILLSLLADVADGEAKLNEQIGTDWTHAMVDLLKDRSESSAQRFILRYAASIAN